MKVDARSLKWQDGIVGDYRNNELGSLSVRVENGQYRAQFQSLRSALGVQQQADGRRVAVLISPPWNSGAIAAGEVRLQVTEDDRSLVLDEGQTLYKFERQNPS